MTVTRVTSIIVVAALIPLPIWIIAASHPKTDTTVDSGAADSPAAVTEKVTPPAMTQRWSLIGGDKCEWVIRSVGEAAGSRGLSIECDASADQQLVLEINAKVQAGGWTLRVDDGEQAPNWLPLGGYPASRVAGSKHYRFLIYSDDTRAEISIKDVTIRPTVDTDGELPLVWPPSGPIAERDRPLQAARWLEGWRMLLGLRSDDGVLARAKGITNFVYQRSNVTYPSEPTFITTPREWDMVPVPTVDGQCGTFATAVLDLCEKLDVTARRVALATERFAEGKAIGDTHELVEVFDPTNARWVLFDPSFNLTFEGPDGRLLGLKDLLTAAADGKDWRAVPIGTLRPGRTINDYYLKYEDLLWMGSAPAVPKLGSSGVAFCSRAQTVGAVFRAKYPVPVTP